MLTVKQKFIQYLQDKKQRITASREKVLDMILSIKDHIHLEDIEQWALENNVSRATLFRTLSLLVESGIVAKVFDESNRVHYEYVYKQSKHAHLICLTCGSISEIQEPFSEELIQKICKENNFHHSYNVFSIFGFCLNCQ